MKIKFDVRFNFVIFLLIVLLFIFVSCKSKTISLEDIANSKLSVFKNKKSVITFSESIKGKSINSIKKTVIAKISSLQREDIDLHRYCQTVLKNINKKTLLRIYKDLYEKHIDDEIYIYLYARLLSGEKALKLMDDSIKKNSDFFWPYFSKGFIYFEEKIPPNLIEAEKNFFKAIYIDKQNPLPYFGLKKVYQYSKNTEKYLSVLKILIKLIPDDDTLYIDFLKKSNLSKNVYEKHIVERYLENEKNKSHSIVLLDEYGDILWKKKIRFDLIEKIYKEIIKKKGNRAKFYFRSFYSKLKQKKIKDNEQSFLGMIFFKYPDFNHVFTEEIKSFFKTYKYKKNFFNLVKRQYNINKNVKSFLDQEKIQIDKEKKLLLYFYSEKKDNIDKMGSKNKYDKIIYFDLKKKEISSRINRNLFFIKKTPIGYLIQDNKIVDVLFCFDNKKQKLLSKIIEEWNKNQ